MLPSGLIFLVIFFLICCTILTNLFIAMIGNTISTMQAKAKQESHFNLAWTVAFYGAREALPPPFNLLHLGSTLFALPFVFVAELVLLAWSDRAKETSQAGRLASWGNALQLHRRSLWRGLRKDPHVEGDPSRIVPLFAWYDGDRKRMLEQRNKNTVRMYETLCKQQGTLDDGDAE